MKISVIMVDGSFRENLYGADYFTRQDFPREEYEVIWVEFYRQANPGLDAYRPRGLQVVTLGNAPETTYHSSFCFNEGIRRAKGDILVIPDADQIVEPDFLSRVYRRHQENDKLVVYGHRLDEVKQGALPSLEFEDLKQHCRLTNIHNRGGCLTVRKKWLVDINGYEQHDYFKSGFHANGTDIYYRLLNYGLAVAWDRDLRLYHPWHPFSRVSPKDDKQYQLQFHLLNWRMKQFETQPFAGLDPARNCRRPFPFDVEPPVQLRNQPGDAPGLPRRIANRLKQIFA